VVSTRNVTEPGYSPWVIYFVWITDRILYYMKHGHPNKRRGAAEARRRWNVLPTIIPWDHYAGDNSYIRMVHDVASWFRSSQSSSSISSIPADLGWSCRWVVGEWVSKRALSLSLSASGVPTFLFVSVGEATSDGSERRVEETKQQPSFKKRYCWRWMETAIHHPLMSDN
jgi:hypothetical protein